LRAAIDDILCRERVMTDEVSMRVRQIRARSHAVTSFLAEYRALLKFQLVRIEVTGKTWFLSPDRFRAETRIADEQIITVRRGHAVQRYIPKRKEIWKYGFGDLPQTEPINFGIADLRDPFFAVDETGLIYEGMADLEKIATFVFSAQVKNWATQGLLDTRKGFSIRYMPKNPGIRVKLHVSSETGLLRRMTGTDQAGEKLFQADYFVTETNIPIDESLFAMDESRADYKVIDIADTMLTSLNPDAADSPPSIN
jgi:outer membrane lipoprotein-sorting protein